MTCFCFLCCSSCLVAVLVVVLGGVVSVVVASDHVVSFVDSSGDLAVVVSVVPSCCRWYC